MVTPGSSFGFNCKSKLGLDIPQKEESKRKVRQGLMPFSVAVA